MTHIISKYILEEYDTVASLGIRDDEIGNC